MNKKKILICGDSFAADWTIKYTELTGWPNLFDKTYEVTNLAQAGCCEYKIYLQLKSVDINNYDIILVSHTSPYRIYVKEHPVHNNNILHKNSDLIYPDLKEHSKTNRELDSIIDFFEKYFDENYAKFTHNLICKEIDLMLQYYNGNVIHITNLYWKDLYQFDNMINFEFLFKKHRGLMNHYTNEGNQIIFNTINNLL